MTRFLIVNTDYPAFLESLYAANPNLETQGYERKRPPAMPACSASPISIRGISFNSGTLRSSIRSITAGCRKPGRERGLALSAAGSAHIVLRRGFVPWVVRDQAAWMEQILAAQIEDFRPDVIVSHSLSDLRPAFWSRMRTHYRLLVGQIASPLSPDIDLSPFDLMLSSLPNFVERFRAGGLRAELFRLAFDPVVLERLVGLDLRKPPIEVSFVGSLSTHHAGRLEWLEYVCERIPVQVWGNGVDCLPKDSSIRRAYRGPAWGVEMFDILPPLADRAQSPHRNLRPVRQ